MGWEAAFMALYGVVGYMLGLSRLAHILRYDTSISELYVFEYDGTNLFFSIQLLYSIHC